MATALTRNLTLYTWHQPIAGTLFWGPIFFLLLGSHFSVDRVIQLSALYYVSVVILEVPSGYFSDRISRVATLRISAAAMALAYALFATGGDRFWVYAIAECTLALGYAFRSGTDTSFHFDTLAGLSREREFGQREARITRNRYFAVSASALIGGIVATADLRFAYALSAAFSAAALGIAFAMHEPPRGAEGLARPRFTEQLSSCFGYLSQPLLAWIFAYMTVMTTLEHIPWQFAQPYLASVFGESLAATEKTPAAAGALHACFSFVAAFASANSLWLRDRLGVGGALLAVTGLQTALIVGMALVVHPLMAALLIGRSVQPAVSNVIVQVEVAPRVRQGLRATYLSLHSFSGRLGYAAALFGLSAIGARSAPTETEHAVGDMLTTGSVIAIVALLALSVTRGALRPAGES